MRRSDERTKHGFDFVDAKQVFEGATYTYEDDRLRYDEQRFVSLGLLREIAVSIVHTEENDHIHIIRDTTHAKGDQA